MSAKIASFLQRPRWVAALVIVTSVIVWSFSVYSNLGQIGRPFPRFFHTPAILLHVIPGHASLIFLCVAFGIFVCLPATDWNRRRS